MQNTELQNLIIDAEVGISVAQYQLGNHYLNQNDKYRAIIYLQKSAVQNHPEGCYAYAKLLLEESRFDEATKYFLNAAKGGLKAAQQAFGTQGVLYQKTVKILFESRYNHLSSQGGLITQLAKAYMDEALESYRSDKIAIQLLNMAVNNTKNIEAAKILAEAYTQPKLGLEQNYAEAYRILSDAARGMNYNDSRTKAAAEIYFKLGEMYKKGQGVEKSNTKAIEYYQKAADLDYQEAIFPLGYLYYLEYDRLRKENYWCTDAKQKAMEYLSKVTHLSSACNVLGIICDYSQNYQEGKKYYLMAVDMGLGVAARNLAMTYAGGHFGEDQKSQAIVWYQKAAELGHTDSQYILAEKLAKGDGVEKNVFKAFEWYLKAAESNNEDAKKRLNEAPFLHYHELYKTFDQNFDKVRQYYQLEQKIGHHFAQPNHLLNALDRRKKSGKIDAPFQCYELLGDSVLSTACVTALVAQKPDTWSVNDLHNIKQDLVKNDTVLPKIAQSLDLSEFIQLDETEAKHPITSKMLADAMEAVIGAISLDAGTETAIQVTQNLWATDIKQALSTKPKPHAASISPAAAQSSQPKKPVALAKSTKSTTAKTKSPAPVPTPKPQKPKKNKTLKRELSANSLGFFKQFNSISPAALSTTLKKNPKYATMPNCGKKALTPLMIKIKQLDQIVNNRKRSEAIECIRVLIENGASLTEKDGKGITALELLQNQDKISPATKEKIMGFSRKNTLNALP